MKKIYVISDLHLGGRPDGSFKPPSRICYTYGALVDFVRWLKGQGEPGSIELVLNGDIVDFLLDDDYPNEHPPRPWTLDEIEVISKLEHIDERTRTDAGTSFFDSLREYVADGHSLTLILGNHDIELALPSVRNWLFERINANSRNVKFIYDGEAYVCGDLLIEHGNRYDRFNAVNHSALRQERSVLSRRIPPKLEFKSEEGRFKSPAGSYIVINVLNKIKENCRFVDILKPENEAVIPLLLALYPESATLIATIMKLVGECSNTNIANREDPESFQAGFLAAENEHEFTLEHIVSETGTLNEAETLLQAFNGNMLSSSSITDQYELLKGWLPVAGAILSRFTKENAGLITALKKMHKANTFNIENDEGNYYKEARALANHGSFKVIIFGHTHLPKKINFKKENGMDACYINTGTWADLMRIPTNALTDDVEGSYKLGIFIEALKGNHFDDYRHRYPTYAEIIMHDNLVEQANLFSFVGNDMPKAPPLTHIETRA